MKLKQSVSTNFIFNFLNQILAVLVPFITVPYLARTLGPAGIGEYSFALSLVAYFASFTNLGVNLYGQRQIAYLKNENKEVYSKVFWELVLLRVCLGIISSVTYFLLIVRISDSYLLSALLTLEILNMILDIQWLFQGFENFRIITIRNFIVKTVTVLAIFIFVKSSSDIAVYALIMSVGFASMWLALRYYVVKVSFNELHVFSHLKGALALYLPQVAIQVYTVLDKTMLGIITKSNLENGYYEQANKVVLVLLMGVTALSTVMIPRISAMFAAKDQEQINRYLGKSFSYVWLVGFPITFGIFAVADTFVPFFFGVGYEPVIRLLCLFSLIIIPIGISNIVGLQYLVTTGNEYYLTKSVVLGAIVNFGLNMLFIRWWQATGATLASVITEVIIMVFQLWVVRDFLPVVDYMKSMKNYLVAAIVMYVVLILMPIYFDKAIFLLMSKVIFGSIIYLICLLGMKDSFFREIIGKVIGMASKKKARDRV